MAFIDYSFSKFYATRQVAKGSASVIEGDETAHWLIGNSEFFDCAAIYEKAKSLPFGNICVITEGEFKGVYVFSEKTKESFYCETEEEERRRTEREREDAGSFRRCDYDQFENDLDAATEAGYRLRIDQPEFNDWITNRGISIDLIKEQMGKILNPKITIISSGRSEGLYLYSLKVRQSFYYETKLERDLIESSSLGRHSIIERRDLRIFISYRRKDALGISGRVYDRLISEIGETNVFMDVDSIPLGVNFADFIVTQLSDCSVVVALIGPLWKGEDETGARIQNEADFVRIEIASALKMDIPIVPVLIGGASMPNVEHLPASISKLTQLNGMHLDHGIDFNNHINRLMLHLNGSS